MQTWQWSDIVCNSTDDPIEDITVKPAETKRPDDSSDWHFREADNTADVPYNLMDDSHAICMACEWEGKLEECAKAAEDYQSR